MQTPIYGFAICKRLFLMENHRYKLQKYSGMKTKFQCPKCKDKRSFVKYIDIENNQYLSDHVGRCDNEGKCGYHYKPKQFFNDNNIQITPSIYFNSPKQSKPQQIYFFPTDIFNKSLKGYEQNTFINNLLNNVPFPFQINDVFKIIDLYKLGTITKGIRSGAVTLPFIDTSLNVRAVQVKQFDNNNHTTATDFLHSIIERTVLIQGKPLPSWLLDYNKNDKKVTCLFGSHLLNKYPKNPIALVEAPKTAIYGTLYFGFPEESQKNFLWLAVYNKSSFTLDKIKILQGRDIYTFPDTSTNGITYNEWKQKATEFEKELKSTRFIFSDLLEQFAPETDKQKGYDIADYLIKTDWLKYRKDKNTITNIPTENQTKIEHQTISPIPTSSEQISQLNHLCEINPNIAQFINVLGLELIINK